MLVVALVAFAARAALLRGLGRDSRFALTPDSVAYLREAGNLARDGAFSLSEAPPLVPDTIRTPGYPFLLSRFVSPSGVRARAVQWFQALLGAATAALVFRSGLVLWGCESAALFAGLCAALDPMPLLHGPLLLTETLFLFLFTAASWALAVGLKKKSPAWAAQAGLFLGLSALTRPVALYYFVFAGAVAAWNLRKQRVRTVWLAVFFSASGALPLAWMARNKAVSGAFTFCSIQGLNFFVRAQTIAAEAYGLAPDQAAARVESELAAEHPGGFATTAEEARFKGAWAARFVAAHPLPYAEVMVKDVVKILGGHGAELFAWLVLKDSFYDPMRPQMIGTGGFSGTKMLLVRHRSLRLAIPLYILMLGAGYALALIGFWDSFRKERWGALLCASVVVYCLGVTAGLGAYYRLRIPLLGAVYLLAGRGWTLIKERSAGRA